MWTRERIISWGLVGTLASVVVVQQVELHSTVVKFNPVDPAMRALMTAMAQAHAVKQQATRDDLKALPSDNFRSGPVPWGRGE
jgi:hypothetical protein